MTEIKNNDHIKNPIPEIELSNACIKQHFNYLFLTTTNPQNIELIIKAEKFLFRDRKKLQYICHLTNYNFYFLKHNLTKLYNFKIKNTLSIEKTLYLLNKLLLHSYKYRRVSNYT
jgi:hypothetical protein